MNGVYYVVSVWKDRILHFLTRVSHHSLLNAEMCDCGLAPPGRTLGNMPLKSTCFGFLLGISFLNGYSNYVKPMHYEGEGRL